MKIIKTMTNLYIGIDPGITGAIGFLFDNNLPDVIDVPTYQDFKDKPQYNFREMYRLIARYSRVYNLHIALEQQQAMPQQGVSSTFKTGRGYGAWEALCAVITDNYDRISPRKWKKAIGLTSDKEVSRFKAIELFPSLASMLCRKKDHNRAEALLLAYYSKNECERNT